MVSGAFVLVWSYADREGKEKGQDKKKTKIKHKEEKKRTKKQKRKKGKKRKAKKHTHTSCTVHTLFLTVVHTFVHAQTETGVTGYYGGSLGLGFFRLRPGSTGCSARVSEAGFQEQRASYFSL